MADCIFVSHSLHAELLRTMDEGDHEEAANVTSEFHVIPADFGLELRF